MNLVVSQNLFDEKKCQHGFFGRGTGLDDIVFQTSRASRVKQVHGMDCHVIDRPVARGEWVQADAIVTSVARVPIGVVTADCAPVLFYGEKQDGNPVIGAAHAGWRGAVKGILDNTVKAMVSEGAILASIRGVIGPCLGLQSYEVSQGFEQEFVDHHPVAARFFMPHAGKPDKLMFDLPCYCAFRLGLVGVDKVDITGVDTLVNNDRFYSYRKMTMAGLKNDGRQLSAMMISMISS